MHKFHSHPTESFTSPERAILFLRPEQIRASSTSKYVKESPNSIIRLAQSIKKYGILEPLAVQPMQSPEEFVLLYHLISGERRLRAAIIAGIEQIPCIIAHESDKDREIFGLLEHAKEKTDNFFEQARVFRTLATNFSLTQEEIARKTGLSQSAIANKLRLLHFSFEEQQQILSAGFSERHARAILRLTDPQERAHAIHYIRKEHLNVADAEQFIERMREKATVKPLVAPGSTTAYPLGNLSKTELSTPVPLPQRQPSGPRPQKLALSDLTPLYNSIERVLSIFRKTGATATCCTEEGEGSARITIQITRNT